jgi:hypothetical protein
LEEIHLILLINQFKIYQDEYKMDYSELSKDELIALLKANRPEPIDESKPHCKFIPKKGNERCREPISTEWGFCRKHSSTMQSLKAEKEWILSQNSTPKEDIKEETPVEPITPAPTPPIKPEPVKQEPVKQEPIKPEAVKEPVKPEPVKPEPVKQNKMVLRPNHWRRFEEPETHIIFDPERKKAYGVQDHTTGKVLALSKKHIQICKERNWPYLVIQNDSSSEDESEEEDSDGNDYDSDD